MYGSSNRSFLCHTKNSPHILALWVTEVPPGPVSQKLQPYSLPRPGALPRVWLCSAVRAPQSSATAPQYCSQPPLPFLISPLVVRGLIPTPLCAYLYKSKRFHVPHESLDSFCFVLFCVVLRQISSVFHLICSFLKFSLICFPDLLVCVDLTVKMRF